MGWMNFIPCVVLILGFLFYHAYRERNYLQLKIALDEKQEKQIYKLGAIVCSIFFVLGYLILIVEEL